MTNDFKPTLPFVPKTETRIFLGGRPIDQQTEQTGSKGISKQHYQSERANEINPGYGPGFFVNEGGGSSSGNSNPYGYGISVSEAKGTCKVSECYETVCRDSLCYKHWEEVPSNALGNALTVGGGFLAGPAAPVIGAAVWGVGQMNKSDSGVSETLSDIGKGLFFGGILDNAVSRATKTGCEYARELNNAKKVLDGLDYSEQAFHAAHLASGVRYDSNCLQCNRNK